MTRPDTTARPGGQGSVVGRAVAAIVAVVLIAGVAACGLPTDDRAQPYNVDELPPGLTETTTTTSTTTTTTTMPPATVPGETTTTTSTTTTLFAQTKPVTVFYTLSGTDELAPLDFDQSPDVGPTAVVALLESPPPGIDALNLRSSVRRGLIEEEELVVDRAVATIALDPIILDLMATPELRRAIAQIVLTFTSFSTPDEGNIGFVEFEVDGEPFPVFVPSENGTSPPGALLAFSDYAELISTTASPTATATTPTTTTTSTTTTSTTTTVPGVTIAPG